MSLDKLTKEQEAKIPEYVDKFFKIGTNTDPADFEMGKLGIKELYEVNDLKCPPIITVESPFQCHILGPMMVRLLEVIDGLEL